MNKLFNSASIFALAHMARSGAQLQEVPHEPEVIETDTTQIGGVTVTSETPLTVTTTPPAAETGPVVAFGTYEEFDETLVPRKAPAAAIDFGFKTWPVGGHAMVKAELAQRARAAVQTARKDKKGNDNGKQFITRHAAGVAINGVKVYPDAKEGDIEVIRFRDKSGFKDGVAIPAAPAAEAPKETANA